MKKTIFFLIICYLQTTPIYAQDAKDSLLILLKKHPQEDIQRCYILSELRRNEVRNFREGDIYDTEAYEIAIKKIPTIKNNPKLLKEYKSFLADYYYGEGIDYSRTNDFEKAESFILKSLKIEQEIKRYADIGCNLKALAKIYLKKGEIPKSISYYNESIKVLTLRKGDVVEENNYLIDAYDNLANIYYNKGDTQKAIQLLYEKLRITTYEKSNIKYNKRLNNNNIATTYNKIGFFYAKEGEDKKALTFFDKAFKIQKSINNKDGLADVYRNFGTFYLDRNDFKKANTYFNLSTELTETEFVKIENIASKGQIYLQKNNLDSATILLEKALKHAIKSNAKSMLSKLYYDLAQVNIKKVNWKLAQNYAQKSFEMSQQKSNVLETQMSAELLYVIHKNTNNKSEALKMLEITHILGDSINKRENKNATLKGEFKYETELKESQIKTLAQQKQISELQSTRKSTLIYSILGGIVALAAVAYFSFTRFKVRKENELLSTQLEEAEKRIKIEQKATESELKALKSQMNPHFMFNALNSIQEQFMFGDKNLANEQMGNFTYLTRQILSISGKKKINLSTEIELLTKYLELEKMRFAEGFKYEINLTDKIDEDYHQIPPMLIQPFVENSIKHGLLHKIGNKNIHISFDLDDAEENLICIVEDNGIGRAKSAEIKSKQVQQHESFSTSATEERLKLLSQNIDAKDFVVYHDKADGTSVTIKIPL
jgi:two-component system, LytTR family, sensor kinase